MELHEYVTETLKQIINGVKTAQKFATEADAQINPTRMGFGKYGEPILNLRGVVANNERHGQMVEFDVAITVTEGDQVKGGIGVFAGPLGVGTQAQTATSNVAVNRIKFSIPVFLPEQKKQKQSSNNQ